MSVLVAATVARKMSQTGKNDTTTKNSKGEQFVQVILPDIVRLAHNMLINSSSSARENLVKAYATGVKLMKNSDSSPDTYRVPLRRLVDRMARVRTIYTDIVLAPQLCTLCLAFPDIMRDKIDVTNDGSKMPREYIHGVVPDIYLENIKEDDRLKHLIVYIGTKYFLAMYRRTGEYEHNRVGICDFFTMFDPENEEKGKYKEQYQSTCEALVNILREVLVYVPMWQRVACRNSLYQLWSTPFASPEDRDGNIMTHFIEKKLKLRVMPPIQGPDSLFLALHMGVSAAKMEDDYQKDGVQWDKTQIHTKEASKTKQAMIEFLEANANIIASRDSDLLSKLAAIYPNLTTAIMLSNDGAKFREWFSFTNEYKPVEYTRLGEDGYPRIDVLKWIKQIHADHGEKIEWNHDVTTSIMEVSGDIKIEDKIRFENVIDSIKEKRRILYRDVLACIAKCEPLALVVLKTYGIETYHTQEWRINLFLEEKAGKMAIDLINRSEYKHERLLDYIPSTPKVDIAVLSENTSPAYHVFKQETTKDAVTKYKTTEVKYKLMRYNGPNEDRITHKPVILFRNKQGQFCVIVPHDPRIWPSANELDSRCRFLFGRQNRAISERMADYSVMKREKYGEMYLSCGLHDTVLLDSLNKCMGIEG